MHFIFLYQSCHWRWSGYHSEPSSCSPARSAEAGCSPRRSTLWRDESLLLIKSLDWKEQEESQLSKRESLLSRYGEKEIFVRHQLCWWSRKYYQLLLTMNDKRIYSINIFWWCWWWKKTIYIFFYKYKCSVLEDTTKWQQTSNFTCKFLIILRPAFVWNRYQFWLIKTWSKGRIQELFNTFINLKGTMHRQKNAYWCGFIRGLWYEECARLSDILQ